MRSPYPAYVAANQHMWDVTADSYEAQHGATLDLHGGMAWGCWRQSERRLRVLGDPRRLRGLDVLDIPCGAARWAIGLAKLGARPIGVDVSPAQLGHARRLMARAGVDFPLYCASAEAVPMLPDASIDLIVHDVGAVLFYDPYRFVPEMARVLRPGGRFYLLGPTPWHWVCAQMDGFRLGRRLAGSYFPADGRLPWRREAERLGFPEVRFQLPYGGWIRLFRQCGLVVEDLIELQAPLRSRSSFVGDWTWWARRWPLEHIWVLSKPEGEEGGMYGSTEVLRAAG